MTIAFYWWILAHACKQYGVIIANSRSPYKSVSALYCNWYYYALIDLINIYTYSLLFISSK